MAGFRPKPPGTIRSEIAEQFQLNPDVLVSSGGGGNMMAAIGTGNLLSGIVTNRLGTYGTMSVPMMLDKKTFTSQVSPFLQILC
jgi:sugar (pentulose or hexulose) kinase